MPGKLTQRFNLYLISIVVTQYLKRPEDPVAGVFCNVRAQVRRVELRFHSLDLVVHLAPRSCECVDTVQTTRHAFLISEHAGPPGKCCAAEAALAGAKKGQRVKNRIEKA